MCSSPATRLPLRVSGLPRARRPCSFATRSRGTGRRCSASTRSTGRRPERTSCSCSATAARPQSRWCPAVRDLSRLALVARVLGDDVSGSTAVPLLSDWNGEATVGFGIAFRARRDGRCLSAERVPDRGRYGQGRMDAGERTAGRRRRDRGRFVALALALYAACAIWATWPAVRHDRRPLSGAAGRRLRGGGRRRPPPARLGVLAPRAPARAGRRALGRPVLVPARGGCDAEPAGLAARSPVLAPRPPVRERVGLQPRSCCSPSSRPVRSRCWWLRALGLARGAALVGGLVFALAPIGSGSRPGTCSA